MEVDASIEKEWELFGFGLRNVLTLKKGHTPSALGKKTISLFPNQIDDMTAYSRHTNHENLEGLKDLVKL